MFRGDGDFRTWMFHIARNVSNDYFRKNKLKHQDDLSKWGDMLGHDDNRMEQMQNDDTHYLLTLALDRLAPEKKEVLLLSKYQEKKYKEIGEVLGCTEGAVKVKVFRALQELRDIFHLLEKRV